MKKALWFSIMIVILAAFFASSYPDGLEKVIGKLGFIKPAASSPVLLSDYHVLSIPNPNLSTLIAGLAGIILTFGIFWLTAKLLVKR